MAEKRYHPDDESPEAQLARTRNRLQIMDALVAAQARRDEVLQLASNALTVEEAQAAIMALLGIGHFPAVAVLDMQIRRLTGAERQKLVDEQAELRDFIAGIEDGGH